MSTLCCVVLLPNSLILLYCTEPNTSHCRGMWYSLNGCVCLCVCVFVQTVQTLNSVFNDLFAHSFIFLGEHLFVRLHKHIFVFSLKKSLAYFVKVFTFLAYFVLLLSLSLIVVM